MIFWCNDCSQALCQSCVDEAHEDHSLTSHKTVLRKKVSALIPQLKNFNLPALTLQLKSRRSELEQLEARASVLKQEIAQIDVCSEAFLKFQGHEDSLESFCQGKTTPDFALVQEVLQFNEHFSVIKSYLITNEQLIPKQEVTLPKSIVFTREIVNIRNLRWSKEVFSTPEQYEGFDIRIRCRYEVFDPSRNWLSLALHCVPSNGTSKAKGWSLKVNATLTLKSGSDEKKIATNFNDLIFSEHQPISRSRNVIEWGTFLSPVTKWLGKDDNLRTVCSINSFTVVN